MRLGRGALSQARELDSDKESTRVRWVNKLRENLSNEESFNQGAVAWSTQLRTILSIY